ncbi:peptide ABC transporter permease [Clostridium sp. chh4-2]|uniref:ABC transporter permease n=1 Tax=Clostridium sp. chh4-2 TaxID=2067550 RepID=UPI000CCFB505|nr:ABC transporter permease [Clostridium sp. chh4-2]PNV63554.1 peptide ABC transporter permease [Clostridium sp. chh4-2]
MLKYIMKRLLMLIPIIIGITLFVYIIMSFAPGDAAVLILGNEATEQELQEKRVELGLDKPVIVQYGNYLKNLVKGDFGKSWITGGEVLQEFLHRAPVTLTLGGLSICLSTFIGILLGVVAAVRQHKPIDYISLVLALLFCSLPIFWVALLAQVLFSIKLGWLPATGVDAGFRSYILPALTLCTASLGAKLRMTRSSMLDVLSQDYVRTSRAKGASETYTVMNHVIRNGMMPVITQVGISFARVLGGSVVTETVFSMPGVGAYLTTAVRSRDVPVVMGVLVFMSIMICVVNLFTDLMYAWADPRVKLG